MHPTHPRRWLLYAALFALALPVATLAGPGSMPRHHAGPDGERGEIVAMLEHLKYRLEMTEDQQQQVQSIAQDLQPRFEDLHERMMAAQSGLFDAVHAEQMDEAGIRNAAAAVAAVDADLAVTRATLLQEIRAILTPDQRAEATEMIGEMKAYHADHPGGPHAGMHPRHPRPAGDEAR